MVDPNPTLSLSSYLLKAAMTSLKIEDSSIPSLTGKIAVITGECFTVPSIQHIEFRQAAPRA